jgi:hypothetical protein
MQNWLTETFPPLPGGTVLVYTAPTGIQLGFDPNDPNGLFTSITTTPPSYAALSALPCAANGWQKIFDQWKANGKVA